MSQVWSDQTINTQGELLVLLALADFSNENGISWPSIETLATKSKYSLRGIQGVIKKLILGGKIRVDKGGGPPGSTNVYYILNTPANFAIPPQITASTPANGRNRPPQTPGVDLRGIRQDPSEEIHKEIRVGVIENPDLPNPTADAFSLKRLIGELYSRKNGDLWSYEEEHSLSVVCKRPHAMEEFKEIKGLHKNSKYFPESAKSLLSGWTTTLDRARKRIKQEVSKMPSPGCGNF